MPCNDITEILKLTLDNDDRIVEYSLRKITCGGNVAGQSLMRPWLKHKTVEEALAVRPVEILKSLSGSDELREYLHLKHLYSIQSALRVLTGESSGEIGQACVISALEQDENGTRLTAEIHIDLLTDEIKACNRGD